MLLTRQRLQYLLGGLWVLDALLQLQPQMFTSNMVNSIMEPTLNAQPLMIADSLKWIMQVVASYLVAINWFIVFIQLAIGICLLTRRFVRESIIISLFWALIVWYGGNGLGMLFTGQASALTGAPASVMFYALLGLVIYPRDEDERQGFVARSTLRWILAAFWAFAAVLQLQPYWWQVGQISQTISSLYSPGTLSGLLVDPSLHWFANITQNAEGVLNAILVVLFLALAIGIAFVRPRYLPALLSISIFVSILLWWITQAFGMLFTGMATDPNSAPLLIIVALACWPTLAHYQQKQHLLPHRNGTRERLESEFAGGIQGGIKAEA